MSYAAFDTWWWPYLFIAIAGWLGTDIWRWLGVLVGLAGVALTVSGGVQAGQASPAGVLMILAK